MEVADYLSGITVQDVLLPQKLPMRKIL